MNRRKLFLLGNNPCVEISGQALEYISKIGANPTLEYRILDFYKVLCENKIYSELILMYPMLGDNADNNKFDAISKNNGAYDLTYVGEEGLDFSKGIKGDGVGYASTNYHETVNESNTNCVHFVINEDVRQDNNASYLYGARYGLYNNLYTALYDSGQMNTAIGQSTYLIRYTPSSRLGVWTFRRISEHNGKAEGKEFLMEIYHNGNLVHSAYYRNSIQPPIYDYYLLAENNNGRIVDKPTKNGLGFFALSKNLLPIQIQKLHTELAELQIFLNRKNW